MANPDDITALADAFSRAHYMVPELGDAARMHVGALASAIEARIAATDYGFITAWNPDSASAARIDNDCADGELGAEIDRLGCRRLRAHAQDDQGAHREEGWLVLDLPLQEMDRLARRFGQDGVLTWRAGQPVRLRLYHPEPADAADRLWVDWAA
jgi:uncharacterized protein DUF3293